MFGQPVASELLVGHATVLEAPQAGIARQLAVLDDASPTGTGQFLAEVREVAGAMVAAKLTGPLVREIVVRGSRDGPLAPLADQLNHDVTHLQGQRLEDMLGQLTNEIQDTLAPLSSCPAMTTIEGSAPTGDATSSGTFFGPMVQGRDIRMTVRSWRPGT